MFSWIFKSRSKLKPIETRIIEAVADALPKNVASLLRMQVSLFNKVQRIDQGREVDFYRMENGKPIFPEIALFTNRDEDFELARVHLSDIATGHQTRATVKLVRGRLFSIEFSHTPRDLSGSNGLKIKLEQLTPPN
jgi:hypothetical protein